MKSSQQKPSELFEGENSSLRKTFDKAVEQEVDKEVIQRLEDGKYSEVGDKIYVPGKEEWEDKFWAKINELGFHLGYLQKPRVEQLKNFIKSLLSHQKQDLINKAKGMKEKKIYDAMVRMGDLSFGNYTPTEIYCKALDDFIKLLEEK